MKFIYTEGKAANDNPTDQELWEFLFLAKRRLLENKDNAAALWVLQQLRRIRKLEIKYLYVPSNNAVNRAKGVALAPASRIPDLPHCVCAGRAIPLGLQLLPHSRRRPGLHKQPISISMFRFVLLCKMTTYCINFVRMIAL